MNRRGALNLLAGAITASGLLPHCARATVAMAVARRPHEPQPSRQPYIETGDGTQLFYQDWGAGTGILFIQ